MSVRACGNAMAGRLAEAGSFHFTIPLFHVSSFGSDFFFLFPVFICSCFLCTVGDFWKQFPADGICHLHLSGAVPVLPLHQVNLGHCPGVLLCSLYPKHWQMCQLQPSWEVFLPCSKLYSLTALEVPHPSMWPSIQSDWALSLFLKVAWERRRQSPRIWGSPAGPHCQMRWWQWLCSADFVCKAFRTSQGLTEFPLKCTLIDRLVHHVYLYRDFAFNTGFEFIVVSFQMCYLEIISNLRKVVK